MRLSQTVFFLLTLFTTLHAFAIPSLTEISASSQDLFRRKGGGGKGGSSGSSSSGSSGGSSGSSSSGSRGGGSSSSSSSSSSTRPSYGGNTYYGGGATSAYSAGRATPGGLRAGPILAGGAAALLVFGAANAAAHYYPYYYGAPWHYYNQTSNMNQTAPVQCLCEENAACGCDESNNSTQFQTDVANNQTIARALSNGTLVVNGTLDNDAIDATNTGAGVKMSPGASGWLVVVAGVAYTMWFI